MLTKLCVICFSNEIIYHFQRKLLRGFKRKMRISEICSRNLDSQIKILRDGSQLHTVLFRHHMLAFRNVTLITLCSC